jgi:HlyD family secretion protein
MAGLGWFWWRDHIFKGDYQLETVQRTNLEIKLPAHGILSPVVTALVRSQVTGIIEQVLVEVNSQVKTGQVLARIDPASLQFKVDQAKAHQLQAQANLSQCQVKLEQAKLDYKRSQFRWKQNLASREDFDQAYNTYANSLADLQAAQTRLLEAETAQQQSSTALRDNDIVSPVDGIVVFRQIKVGQSVMAGPQTTPLFAIATDLTKIQVDATLDEIDGVKVKVGQNAAFTVDTVPGRTFPGVVTQVTPVVQAEHQANTFKVVMQTDNPDLILKPGMAAQVDITLAQRRQILAVPEAALRYRPHHEEAKPDDNQVWKLGPHRRPVPVPVAIGLSANRWTEIIQGDLQEGDQVIVTPRR